MYIQFYFFKISIQSVKHVTSIVCEQMNSKMDLRKLAYWKFDPLSYNMKCNELKMQLMEGVQVENNFTIKVT
jgi:hypothetical protein